MGCQNLIDKVTGRSKVNPGRHRMGKYKKKTKNPFKFQQEYIEKTY